MREFHVSRQARDRYQLDESLFALSGNVILANFHAARIFAQRINQKRNLIEFPEQAAKASQINAMGLIDEILHLVIRQFIENKNPLAIQQAYSNLVSEFGEKSLHSTFLQFIQEFPPLAVYKNEITAVEYIQSNTEGVPNTWLALEEIMVLWLENKNAALTPYHEILDDSHLMQDTAYAAIIQNLIKFFESQPKFGPQQQNLVEMLRAPAIAVPYSITGQLEFIRTHWTDLLGRHLYRLLSSLDLIKEEEKISFAGFGPGPISIPVYDQLSQSEPEPENFSPDREWMPRLVLIAKNSYVWLDQLSKKYQRSITRLDQIPDEELDALARWGFTGLWLIGLWERSQASAKIKQLCGNPEAIASAYSLAGYSIAQDLGGDEGYRNLRDRAWQRGIRLASDMVPNHMGIDSEWVINHPDWFVSLPYSPFPSYSFNGSDLSPDGRVSIYLDDHYFTRTDAAVVFKRYDHRDGQTQYIYHGNDGTSMPWNDTAQLNYLNPEVREAVIQTILEVARKFPIIRFDAAMTLAKKHYQRLWFPEPGSGGDIASRADHGLTKDQFDSLLPVEFWREVVDRVAQESPDTLLLAEAFWLMEGYFVRTLGMHRVYNSAFMNLLRNEETAKYRLVMKNTLEFDPEIMKRFVNFMNNPDERTAVDQFGKGDKYFGICTVMSTLPGLPMFGHGQVEGFSEKYGMEFRRAYWNETVDPYLLERHQREIFPLLHRRALFAGVENFLLYDFFTSQGSVNEDVLAYSNGSGQERALILFHNKFAETSGWVRTSVAYADKKGGSERALVQRTLAEGLSLPDGSNTYVIFRDMISGLEYIRPSLEIHTQGLFVNLSAYKAHVFTQFRVVQDDEWGSYFHLCQYLAGHGVPDMEEAQKELLLQPLLNPFREIAHAGYFTHLLAMRSSSKQPELNTAIIDEARKKLDHFIDGFEFANSGLKNRPDVVKEIEISLATILKFSTLNQQFRLPLRKPYKQSWAYLTHPLETDKPWYILFGYAFLHNLGKLSGDVDEAGITLSWMGEWKLGKILQEAYQNLGYDSNIAWGMVNTVRLLITQKKWYSQSGKLPVEKILSAWLSQEDIRGYIGVNRHQDILWFNREAFEEFVWWMNILAILETTTNSQASATEFIETLLALAEITRNLSSAEKDSGYQVNKLLSGLAESAKPKRG